MKRLLGKVFDSPATVICLMTVLWVIYPSITVRPVPAQTKQTWEGTISVKQITINPETKKVTVQLDGDSKLLGMLAQFGTIEFTVDGKPVPPAPPNPPNPTDGTLMSKLKAALAKDGDTPANRANVLKMAKVAELIAKEIPTWTGTGVGDAKTANDVALVWSASLKNSIGLEILNTRKAAGDWIAEQVSWSLLGNMTAAQRETLAGHFATLAKSLEEAGK